MEREVVVVNGIFLCPTSSSGKYCPFFFRKGTKYIVFTLIFVNVESERDNSYLDGFIGGSSAMVFLWPSLPEVDVCDHAKESEQRGLGQNLEKMAKIVNFALSEHQKSYSKSN